ncbi:PREDICTED: F-box/WD repeat-containing protein 4-like [Vollenhovia emeryi]|uniref:F-box/WD repeat-containing protein 4-like n=1 Tax=Vollenhovia emeryi TaxID=411798 RepID=UPI0005F4AD90|nr:PREDICTED: F-box/WD repeat-containing protein 4-like [Vollenhovia emeryi]
MTNTWQLDGLPVDVLLMIFEFCNEFDLLRLSEVCKRFNDITRKDVLWIKKSKHFLVTNQTSERFRARCSTILSPRTMLFVSYNWRYGIFNKQTMLTQRAKLIPWLKMTNDMLWWSGNKGLLGFGRGKEATIDETHGNCYRTEPYIGGDICKFVLWKNFIICGYMDGSVNYFLKRFDTRECCIAKILPKNNCSVNAIDATSTNLVAGLENGTVKILRHPDMDTPEKTIYRDSQVRYICLQDKVRSLSVDPTEAKCAVGSSGINSIPPLHVIDMERYTMVDTIRHTWRHGAGILDMVWDDPNTLLTCGYDTCIRKWDLRSGRCVCSWADPFDATPYCISSDYRYSMVTGTQYNCMAVLWDQRKSDFVQLYYVNTRTSTRHSPIYSIQFDSSHLYCATDRLVIELSFSAHSCQKYDYKSLLSSYVEQLR